MSNGKKIMTFLTRNWMNPYIFFLSFIYKRINKFIVVRFCALLLAIVYEHKRVILKGENPDYQQC